ncbi:hypothetical protein ES703_52138 [subsurface metagenome]
MGHRLYENSSDRDRNSEQTRGLGNRQRSGRARSIRRQFYDSGVAGRGVELNKGGGDTRQ